MTSQEEIKRVATAAHDNVINEVSNAIWPECFEVSERIRDLLYKDLEIEHKNTKIIELQINDEYGHYVVKIDSTVLGETMIVDGSFKQFANETDTPYGICPIDRIEPVVIVPKKEYVFIEWETQTCT
jgi:hypothetical protein